MEDLGEGLDEFAVQQSTPAGRRVRARSMSV